MCDLKKKGLIIDSLVPPQGFSVCWCVSCTEINMYKGSAVN